jgi:hypothetical protein
MKNTHTHTHTPGPWRIDSKTRFGDYTIAAGDSVKTCEFIAKTQNEANAQLIAAAPDLLAALIAMINRYGDKSEHPFCDASISARAALAKAEGRA